MSEDLSGLSHLDRVRVIVSVLDRLEGFRVGFQEHRIESPYEIAEGASAENAAEAYTQTRHLVEQVDEAIGGLQELQRQQEYNVAKAMALFSMVQHVEHGYDGGSGRGFISEALHHQMQAEFEASLQGLYGISPDAAEAVAPARAPNTAAKHDGGSKDAPPTEEVAVVSDVDEALAEAIRSRLIKPDFDGKVLKFNDGRVMRGQTANTFYVLLTQALSGELSTHDVARAVSTRLGVEISVDSIYSIFNLLKRSAIPSLGLSLSVVNRPNPVSGPGRRSISYYRLRPYRTLVEAIRGEQANGAAADNTA